MATVVVVSEPDQDEELLALRSAALATKKQKSSTESKVTVLESNEYIREDNELRELFEAALKSKKTSYKDVPPPSLRNHKFTYKGLNSTPSVPFRSYVVNTESNLKNFSHPAIETPCNIPILTGACNSIFIPNKVSKAKFIPRKQFIYRKPRCGNIFNVKSVEPETKSQPSSDFSNNKLLLPQDRWSGLNKKAPSPQKTKEIVTKFDRYKSSDEDEDESSYSEESNSESESNNEVLENEEETEILSCAESDKGIVNDDLNSSVKCIDDVSVEENENLPSEDTQNASEDTQNASEDTQNDDGIEVVIEQNDTEQANDVVVRTVTAVSNEEMNPFFSLEDEKKIIKNDVLEARKQKFASNVDINPSESKIISLKSRNSPEANKPKPLKDSTKKLREDRGNSKLLDNEFSDSDLSSDSSLSSISSENEQFSLVNQKYSHKESHFLLDPKNQFNAERQFERDKTLRETRKNIPNSRSNKESHSRDYFRSRSNSRRKDLSASAMISKSDNETKSSNDFTKSSLRLSSSHSNSEFYRKKENSISSDEDTKSVSQPHINSKVVITEKNNVSNVHSRLGYKHDNPSSNANDKTSKRSKYLKKVSNSTWSTSESEGEIDLKTKKVIPLMSVTTSDSLSTNFVENDSYPSIDRQIFEAKESNSHENIKCENLQIKVNTNKHRKNRKHKKKSNRLKPENALSDSDDENLPNISVSINDDNVSRTDVYPEVGVNIDSVYSKDDHKSRGSVHDRLGKIDSEITSDIKKKVNHRKHKLSRLPSPEKEMQHTSISPSDNRASQSPESDSDSLSEKKSCVESIVTNKHDSKLSKRTSNKSRKTYRSVPGNYKYENENHISRHEKTSRRGRTNSLNGEKACL